jgi:succinoglycan biosynthesis protein ExoM
LRQIEHVDVCVCTYRRGSIVETLRSIGAQRLPEGTLVRVIVVDNDETDSARSVVVEASQRFGLDCRYIHAPARNISVARNAALDTASSTLVAFIDDDEVATPHWLAELLDQRRTTGASIIFGPVQAVYEEGPAWLRQADLHSIRPAFRAQGVIDTGYTCNVLLDRATMTGEMRAWRFDPGLGRSGGEDTFFFHRLYMLGTRIGFAESALVHEAVPPNRTRLNWLLRRSFRSGQTHARVLVAADGWKPSLIATAAIKCGYCAIGAAFRVGSPAGWRAMAVRAALHAGVVCRLSGLADLEIY